MDLNVILVILGSFISLLLMVNAYFTRETLLRVVQIEVKLETNSTRQEYIEKQVNENTYEIKKLRDFRHKHANDHDVFIKILEEKLAK